MIDTVNKVELTAYLEKIDTELKSLATIYIYGSAAYILLDEPERTSLDIDVAAPYSNADYGDFRRAALASGLPVNPDEHYACLLYTSPSPRDRTRSRMPSSA